VRSCEHAKPIDGSVLVGSWWCADTLYVFSLRIQLKLRSAVAEVAGMTNSLNEL